MAPSMQIQAHQRKAKKALSKATASVKSPFKAFKDSEIPTAILAKLPMKLSALARFLQPSSAQPGSDQPGSDQPGPAPPVIARRVGFASLPGEIRNKIWQLAVEAEARDRFVIVDTTIQRIIPLAITAVSPFLSVNRESRYFALKAYPQTIPMKRIDKWALQQSAITSPLSGRVPVARGPDCGVYRYSLETDKFICGFRYVVINDREKHHTHKALQWALEIGRLAPELLSETERKVRLFIPLYLRYTSARLPDHNTREYPQVQNVIGLHPWYWGPEYEQQDDQRGEQTHQNAAQAQDDDDNDDDFDPDKYPIDPGDDTIGPLLRQEYMARQWFPHENAELSALFPGRCFCSSPDFNDEDGLGYQYCYCVHVTIPEKMIRWWLRQMDIEGMPSFRRHFPELVAHGM